MPVVDRRLVLSVPALAVLVGCSTAESSPAPASTPTQEETAWTTPRELPDGWGSGEDDGVFPRTVVHATGSTTLEAEPVRVAVISTGQVDACLTLGVVPVASTAGDGAGTVPDYLVEEHPDADVSTVAELGSRNEPNFEALAALEPDLILVNTAAKDGDVLVTLEAIAPTVVTQGTGLYWKQDLQLLADALGKRQQAQQWLEDHQRRAAEFGAGLATRPTVSFLRKNGSRVRVFGVASFSGSVAEDAGLPRPESQSFTDDTSQDISSEQLNLVDADWLFFGVQGGDESELTSMPTWSTLPAVAAGRAVEVDDDTFYLNTGPTAAQLVLDQLVETLG